jgi:hypothetical protein
MITKEQFLSGTPFHYIHDTKIKPYKFERWPDWKNGDPVGSVNYFMSNEVNVTRVGYSYFDCYTSVFFRIIKVRIYFKDLYL